MAPLLEELSLNALPAARVIHYDGWILRFAEGFTRRANSVNVIGPSVIPFETKIDYCERAYSNMGARTIFKLWPSPDCDALDKMLESTGYAIEGQTWVKTRSLVDRPSPADLTYTLEHQLGHDWLEVARRLNNITHERHPVMERVFRNIVPQHCFAAVRVDGNPVSVALGVVERGWLGLFDVATDPEHKRRGYAANLCAKLLDWASQNGAENAYLQVIPENLAANSLYDAMGFKTQYNYWYRAKPGT